MPAQSDKSDTTSPPAYRLHSETPMLQTPTNSVLRTPYDTELEDLSRRRNAPRTYMDDEYLHWRRGLEADLPQRPAPSSKVNNFFNTCCCGSIWGAVAWMLGIAFLVAGITALIVKTILPHAQDISLAPTLSEPSQVATADSSPWQTLSLTSTFTIPTTVSSMATSQSSIVIVLSSSAGQKPVTVTKTKTVSSTRKHSTTTSEFDATDTAESSRTSSSSNQGSPKHSTSTSSLQRPSASSKPHSSSSVFVAQPGPSPPPPSSVSYKFPPTPSGCEHGAQYIYDSAQCIVYDACTQDWISARQAFGCPDANRPECKECR